MWVWAYVCVRLNCLCARVHAHNFSVTERERGREDGREGSKHTQGDKETPSRRRTRMKTRRKTETKTNTETETETKRTPVEKSQPVSQRKAGADAA